ncbi:MAG: hypothetical protein R3E83_10165 [Burkholderiaceae bacterium]
MGEEIASDGFAQADFQAFGERLADETRLLRQMLDGHKTREAVPMVGFELEAWIIDHAGLPGPDNAKLLARLADPLVVAELARFNLELNGNPQSPRGEGLVTLETELAQTWDRCQAGAHEMSRALVAIGILPTLREDDLNVEHMSEGNRYAALNRQVLDARGGSPLRLDIRGADRLAIAHPNVLLEAAATSFQVHFQTPASQGLRAFNASCLVSAPMVALAANSPYLFQCELWDETRIPLFEQAVDTSPITGEAPHRVTFGEDWLQDSLAECFEDNLERFPPLLPRLLEDPPSQLHHLRLHNGTIWRWNRPLVSVHDDGSVSLRIEHRVLPAGPTIMDMMANAACYVGLAQALSCQDGPPQASLSFASARENFYQAARLGIDARICWPGIGEIDCRRLILDTLLPLADDGLARLQVSAAIRRRYLEVIRARVAGGQTGARWQRAYIREHGRSFPRLLAAYCEHQRSGMPVHEWPV